MRFHLGLGLFSIISFTDLVGPGIAQAATADCMSPDGTCEVSNDAGDFVSCECASGIGVAGGGSNEWDGLSEAELELVCDEQLAMLCGPVPPPDGIPCVSPAGSCVIDNEPDSLSCMCADGSGGGFEGGNAWAGYSEMELLEQCEIELASVCGGAPPPPPVEDLECSSPLGSCTIANEPVDFLECTCADGEGFAGGGGNEWAELSEDELLMECEAQLAEGCAAGSETGDTTDTGEPGDTGEQGDTDDTGGEGSTGGAGSTGEPGETGVDDSGGAEGSSGNPPPATTGEDATDGGSEGSDGGADGDEGGGGTGGCSIATRSISSSWALALLALAGLGRRRRRAA